MEPSVSAAETLFRLIADEQPADRAAAIYRIINDGIEEADWLEFKRGGFISNINDDKLSNALSKYLSAFANTEGGVLIWGIETKENATTKRNCAIAPNHVPSPDAMANRLENIHHTRTNPPVPGVKFLSVVDPASASGGGFVVCYVPLSSHRPHRAEFNQNYYMRFGSHCLHPSPEVLKYLFHPRREASFAIDLEAKASMSGKQFASVRVQATIQNIGSATAREPYIIISSKPNPSEFRSPYPWAENHPPAAPHEYRRGIAGKSSLHPGVASYCFLVDVKYDGFHFAPESQPQTQMLEIDIEVFCLNQSPKKYRVVFNRYEVSVQSIKKLATPIE